MGHTPSWAEIYSIAYICTLGFEKIREILSSEPATLSHKFSVWAWNMWNPCDAAAILFFQIGLILRLRISSMEIGRIIYCVDCIYWYLRILNILGVNKYLGPLVTMMGKMVKNMIYFVVLLLVVLMSFGVARQAIRFPNSEPKWRILRDIFMEPYFMLYGEVYADNIDPDCGEEPSMSECEPGRWITPFAMSVYLLVANILLINLLIAVFNNIFNEVNAVAHQVWMFQRFTVVMEYEQKPVLPPPLIILSHIYLLIRFIIRCLGEGEMRSNEAYDNGLKLFLDNDDMERLYDFEEECVEGYFREQELKLQMSTDERVKVTTERVEWMHQKVEEINKKESTQNVSLQAVEFRIRKLEELNEQTLAHLGVIHRFMATHTSNLDLLRLDGNVELRPRRASERSEAASETDVQPQSPLFPLRRRKLLRSLTDAAFFPTPIPVEDEPTPQRATVLASLDNEDSSSDGDQPDHHEGSKASESHASDDKTEKEIGERVARSGSVDVTSSSVFEGRRNSAGHPASMKQSSCTQSEPDNLLAPPPRGVTWAEPRVAVIPNSSGNNSASNNSRSVLLAMRSEYTSITDELESYCGLLSPPRTPPVSPPPRRGRYASEMSNPEMALHIEKEHLRDAEDCDYQLMEGLIHRRYRHEADISEDLEEDDINDGAFFLTVHNERRQLRRASAIEDETFRNRPTISVTREIEQTLARPTIRDNDGDAHDDKDLSTGPPPASETMC